MTDPTHGLSNGMRAAMLAWIIIGVLVALAF